MSNIFKVALVQYEGKPNDVQANLEKGIKAVKKAKEMGSDLVLFPEMWSIAYAEPYEGAMDDENLENRKEEIQNWYSQAVDKESKYLKTYINLAKELKIAIAITYLEKYNSKPRNAVSIIDRNGNIVLTYAKVHTCDFSMERLLEDGKEFKVCELEYEGGKVKIGAMVCYDREYPESARILMLKGAEIIIVPNACEGTNFRLNQLNARAYENMVGIAMSNYPGENWGHSVAYSPIVFDENGKDKENTIVKAGENEEIVIAEFNLDEIRKFRETECWGNTFRKPKTYNDLINLDVKEPFIRKYDRR